MGWNSSGLGRHGRDSYHTITIDRISCQHSQGSKTNRSRTNYTNIRTGAIYSNSYERVLVYILNVIEWADEDEEYMDEEFAAAMEEQGRRVLRSIVIPKSARNY